MWTALIVATRVVANPVSNVLQKQLAHDACPPAWIILVTHGVLGMVAIPLALGPGRPPWDVRFWACMGLCGVLAIASNTLIVAALRLSDLSVLGPINSWKSIVSLLAAYLIVGEKPGLAGFAGMVLIAAGSLFLGEPMRPGGAERGLGSLVRQRGVQLRVAALVLSALEAALLKEVLGRASAVPAFAAWCLACLPLAGLSWWLHGGARPPATESGTGRRRLGFAALATTTGLMQLTSLLAFERLLVGYALALFQLSTLLSVLLGHHFFQERHLRRRLLGAGIMTGGAILVVLRPG